MEPDVRDFLLVFLIFSCFAVDIETGVLERYPWIVQEYAHFKLYANAHLAKAISHITQREWLSLITYINCAD